MSLVMRRTSFKASAGRSAPSRWKSVWLSTSSTDGSLAMQVAERGPDTATAALVGDFRFVLDIRFLVGPDPAAYQQAHVVARIALAEYDATGVGGKGPQVL